MANLHREAAACLIIAIIGLGRARLHHEVIAAGATEFLEKPIRTKQFRDIVSRWLPLV